MCSLKVEEVQIKYDKQIIVKNISVTIAPQKITTIIGPNGCGKSTLLKAMSRILTCSSGDILLDGVSIFTMDTKRLAKRIAILLQRQENLSGITVEEIVSYGRFPHRKGLRGLGSEDKEIIDWAIKKTQIDELRHRYIDELSGGQRQRVWLAMALIRSTTSPIFSAAAASERTVACVFSASEAASRAIELDSPICLAISRIELDSSSAAEATV